ncbi:MAG TPA: pitrilysin family protein [Thermoanaerobaculia bacterium]|nr:pitrilysin family protein [Thermoanaerobaculia bacterium]
MTAALVLLPILLAAPRAATAPKMNLPVQTRVLSNGLTVVVSEQPGSPVVGLTVLYRIGSRLEPRNRTGFAHLFEHLMFEGTPNAAKGVFDRVCEGSGGTNNGQTRPDVTIYVESFPSAALDRFLWLEADRMKTLAFEQASLDNQRDVVKEEIRVNVQNDPYGLFEYQDLPKALYDKWENAHDGYGDFHDLDAASVADVKSFFAAYYRPNNAVLAVAGDVPAAEVFAKAERFFGGIPRGEVPPRPDLAEPPRPTSAVVVKESPLAKTPALGMGWRMPVRSHADAIPLLLLGELLHNGRAARLYGALVEGSEIATEVSGGFNPFQGGAWYDGTTLLLSRIAYKRGVPHERVLAAFDAEVARIAKDGVPAAELARVKTKILADWYANLESRLGLSAELAQATAFDGRPDGLLEFPKRVEAVTGADVRRAAAWLAPSARATVVVRPPAGGGATAGGAP